MIEYQIILMPFEEKNLTVVEYWTEVPILGLSRPVLKLILEVVVR